MKQPEIAWRYAGPGTSYFVPTRDLSVEEFDAMDAKQQRIVTQSGWWKPADKKADKPKANESEG